jgi:hypothetical protein
MPGVAAAAAGIAVTAALGGGTAAALAGVAASAIIGTALAPKPRKFSPVPGPIPLQIVVSPSRKFGYGLAGGPGAALDRA